MKSIRNYLNEGRDDAYSKYMFNKIIDKCKASKDGIYAYFCDHLSMDANKVFVVINHEIVIPSDECLKELKMDSEWKRREIEQADGQLEFLMNSDSRYYGTIGFTHGIQILKKYYPRLKTYYCNFGWYTFPHEWREIKKDDYYAKICDELFKIR